MPRPRFADWAVQATTTLAAGATATVDIDQIDTFDPQYCIQSTWTQTASATGMSVAIYRGYVINGAVTYTTAGDNVPVDSQPPASSGTPQTVVNDFSVDCTVYPRRIRLQIINLDKTNPMSYTIAADR